MENKHLAIKVDKLQNDITYLLDELISEIEQLESENEDLRREIYNAKNADFD